MSKLLLLFDFSFTLFLCEVAAGSLTAGECFETGEELPASTRFSLRTVTGQQYHDSLQNSRKVQKSVTTQRISLDLSLLTRKS